MRFVHQEERGPRAVSGVRASRQRHDFPAAALVDDPVQPDVEVIAQRTMLEDGLQRSIRQLVRLFLGIRHQNHVRVRDAAALRELIAVPAIEPDWRIRVRLRSGDKRREFRLAQPLCQRQRAALEPPTTLPRMALREQLVEPPDKRLLFIVEL
jgi:hypothetical protein